MLHTDWIHYSDLGMAVWTRRRLVLDLALVNHGRAKIPSERVPRNAAFNWWSLCRDFIPAKNDQRNCEPS